MSRKLRKKILGDSLIWVIIAAFVVIMLFPFVYILSTALKSDTDLATSVGRILPKAVQWENFTKAWQLLDFPKCFFNSFIVAIAVTALTIFLCSLAAYVFTRLEFKGRNIVFILYLSTMMIPITVRLIPSYNLCRNLNMLDTYMGMILPQVAWSIPFGTFLMRQFYMGIPKQLDEAAKIDGASMPYIIFYLIPRLCTPSIACAALLTFIGAWNEYLVASVLITSQNLYPIQVSVYNYLGFFGREWGPLMASSLMSVIPILLVFTVLGKLLISGLTAGAVKE